MIGLAPLPGGWSVLEQRRRARRSWSFMYAAVLALGLVVAAFAWKRSFQPYIGVASAALVVTMVAFMVRPRLGVGMMVFFALVSDAVTVSWFPFNKNLSSRESILFVSDQLTVSPLELVLLFGVVACGLRGLAETGRPFAKGPLLRPLLAFTFFVVVGFVNGISSGGDVRAAVFEVRPLLYLPLVYLLVTSVATEARHYRQLMWTAMAAVLVQSLLSLRYLETLSPADREGLEGLNEHGSSIAMGALLILLLATLTYRKCSVAARLGLTATAIPVLWVFLVSQRRAAVVALAAAIVLLIISLLWRQRRTLWKIAPITAILTIGYLGAFWNSTSSIGFPAQAIKGVVAPDQLSAADQSSDLYRIIETYDLNYTIRSSPVLGLGFGQPFLRPVALPDISKFEFNAYMPHNSFLWIWIKTGFAGFVTMLYLIGRTIMLGVDRLRRLGDGIDVAMTLTAVLYVVMYTIFTYVDIAWDSRNMVLLGLAMGLCSLRVPPQPARRAALRDDDVVADTEVGDAPAIAEDVLTPA